MNPAARKEGIVAVTSAAAAASLKLNLQETHHMRDRLQALLRRQLVSSAGHFSAVPAPGGGHRAGIRVAIPRVPLPFGRHTTFPSAGALRLRLHTHPLAAGGPLERTLPVRATILGTRHCRACRRDSSSMLRHTELAAKLVAAP